MLISRVLSHTLPVSQGAGLGYMRIKEFTDETLSEVTQSLNFLDDTLLKEQGVHLQALIVDLRGNPGGTLGNWKFLISNFSSLSF